MLEESKDRKGIDGNLSSHEHGNCNLCDYIEEQDAEMLKNLKWAMFILTHGGHPHPTDIDIVKKFIAEYEEHCG